MDNNKEVIHRNPPNVCRQLRREVNFGCPVEGCGSPFLFYHHFDPPWHEKHHNNVEGMIALCDTHHRPAHHGLYSNEQLREMKRNPYLKSTVLKPNECNLWQRNELLVLAGNIYINPHVYLRVDGRDIVWFSRDELNRLELNLDIRDASNNPIIVMRNNNWIEVYSGSEVDDIHFLPDRHKVTVKARELGISFEVKFEVVTQEKLRDLGNKYGLELENKPGPQGPIGPLADLSVEQLAEIFERSTSSMEQELILDSVITNNIIKSTPTKWQTIISTIRSWPVTICEIEMDIKYPSPIYIAPGKEQKEGVVTGKMVHIGSQVIWDLNSENDSFGYLKMSQ